MYPNLYPLYTNDSSGKGREIIGTTLKISGIFPELLADQVPPNARYGTALSANTGLHIEVSFGVDSPSDTVRLMAAVQLIPARWGLLPLAWQPIPYYSGEGGLRVRYELYRKDTSYAAYEYTIKKKGWGGLLLLPLAWVNYVTDDLEDALRATTLQFLIDAQRDGNL
jgi:hypothetical protein